VRERIVEICTRLLAEGIKGEDEEEKKAEQYWVRATLVEALLGLGRIAKSDAEFAIATQAAPEEWMIRTTKNQLAKLRARLPTG
jgi:hypothetical protein